MGVNLIKYTIRSRFSGFYPPAYFFIRDLKMGHFLMWKTSCHIDDLKIKINCFLDMECIQKCIFPFKIGAKYLL